MTTIMWTWFAGHGVHSNQSSPQTSSFQEANYAHWQRTYYKQVYDHHTTVSNVIFFFFFFKCLSFILIRCSEAWIAALYVTGAICLVDNM